MHRHSPKSFDSCLIRQAAPKAKLPPKQRAKKRKVPSPQFYFESIRFQRLPVFGLSLDLNPRNLIKRLQHP
jgi:hypothetical protein